MIKRVFFLFGLIYLSGCSHYVHENEYFLIGVKEVQSRESWNEILCGEEIMAIPGYLYFRKIYGGFIIPFVKMQTVARLPYRVDTAGSMRCPALSQDGKKWSGERQGNMCHYDNRNIDVTKNFVIEGAAGCLSEAVVYEKRELRDYCYACIQ